MEKRKREMAGRHVGCVAGHSAAFTMRICRGMEVELERVAEAWIQAILIA